MHAVFRGQPHLARQQFARSPIAFDDAGDQQILDLRIQRHGFRL
jgi:hypothetical protein